MNTINAIGFKINFDVNLHVKWRYYKLQLMYGLT